MPADTIEGMGAPRAAGDHSHKLTFFRQSGWLMITTVATGFFTWGVHFLSKKVPVAEWGAVVTLLAVVMNVPGMPLQMVFAQQSAAAIATHRERQLGGMLRLAWAGTFVICVLGAIFLFLAQDKLMAEWKITHAAALWVTLIAILLSFWMPMFMGVMQGQQNFLWLGWGGILSGAVRLGSAALIVLAFHGLAASVMGGVAIGLTVAVGIGIWQTRQIWAGPAEAFDRGALLNQMLPLMFGFAAWQFLFSGDMMFVKAYFSEENAAYYGAAGTLSRALVWFVGPITSVMFPKIVHSAARSEKSNLLGLTLLATGILALLGVGGLYVLGPFAVKLVYKPEYVAVAAAVLPWYAGAMVPLVLANVLVNNLLARSHFGIVPVLVLLAIAYGVTLSHVHHSLIQVLQILGGFNLILLAVCALFTWGGRRSDPGLTTP